MDYTPIQYAHSWATAVIGMGVLLMAYLALLGMAACFRHMARHTVVAWHRYQAWKAVDRSLALKHRLRMYHAKQRWL